jgi:hypothetical protein
VCTRLVLQLLSEIQFIVKNLTLMCFCCFASIAVLGCEAPKQKPNSQSAIASESTQPNETKPSETEPSKGEKQPEPKKITVQHCLIGFKGSVPGKPIKRSKEEAKELATKLLAELRAGADFDEIIRKNTDDSPPGIYKMVNFGVSPESDEVFPRGDMVPAFGDTGFPLQVGEYGLAEFDRRSSPYGWHIVKRIE